MEFVGQQRLLREVAIIERELMSGRFLNLALYAPSGWGKTTLAYKIINDTCGLTRAQISGPPEFWVKPERAINFLDEIHMLAEQESLYSYLDWGGSTFIIATNEPGDIKEALNRRCIPLAFDPYTLEDMTRIASNILGTFCLPNEIYESIAARAKLSPGILKSLCQRVSYIFRNVRIPSTTAELDTMLTEILAIDKSGLNPVDRRYLEVLRNCGGRASIRLICNSLHLGETTVLRDIEPQLLYLGYIKITPKGRELCQ